MYADSQLEDAAWRRYERLMSIQSEGPPGPDSTGKAIMIGAALVAGAIVFGVVVSAATGRYRFHEVRKGNGVEYLWRTDTWTGAAEPVDAPKPVSD